MFDSPAGVCKGGSNPSVSIEFLTTKWRSHGGHVLRTWGLSARARQLSQKPVKRNSRSRHSCLDDKNARSGTVLFEEKGAEMTFATFMRQHWHSLSNAFKCADSQSREMSSLCGWRWVQCSVSTLNCDRSRSAEITRA